MTFNGFPEAALDFYDDLELDNTKSFWEANKAAYQESVLAPTRELAAALAEEFGAAKVFRPHRDVRFAKEKSTVNAKQRTGETPVIPTDSLCSSSPMPRIPLERTVTAGSGSAGLRARRCV